MGLEPLQGEGLDPEKPRVVIMNLHFTLSLVLDVSAI